VGKVIWKGLWNSARIFSVSRLVKSFMRAEKRSASCLVAGSAGAVASCAGAEVTARRRKRRKIARFSAAMSEAREGSVRWGKLKGPGRRAARKGCGSGLLGKAVPLLEEGTDVVLGGDGHIAGDLILRQVAPGCEVELARPSAAPQAWKNREKTSGPYLTQRADISGSGSLNLLPGFWRTSRPSLKRAWTAASPRNTVG
jgi:hypothetical protein